MNLPHVEQTFGAFRRRHPIFSFCYPWVRGLLSKVSIPRRGLALSTDRISERRIIIFDFPLIFCNLCACIRRSTCNSTLAYNTHRQRNILFRAECTVLVHQKSLVELLLYLHTFSWSSQILHVSIPQRKLASFYRTLENLNDPSKL